MWTPPALRDAFALFVRRAAASAERRASSRFLVSEDCLWRSAISLAGVPMRVILNLGEDSGSSLSGVGG